MKRFSQTILLLAVMALVTPAPAQDKPAANGAASPAKLFDDPVIARAKGVEIKRSQLDELATGFKANAAGRGQRVPDDQMLLIERQLLDRLIQMRLLLQKATDEDKAKGKESGQQRFEAVKKRSASDENLERQLKAMGMTLQQLESRLIEEATAEKVLERELKPKDLTEAQAREFYDQNPADFEYPEMVRASHILIGTRNPETGQPLSDEQKTAKRKQIDDLLKRARDGEDFAKLAKEFTEDPGSKDAGGEYKFPRGQMVPAFEKAAFALETNQVSDVVTTDYGYHIIKLSEKYPAKKESFAGTATKLAPDPRRAPEATISDVLSAQVMQKEIPAFLEKLKAESNVEILDERLKQATLPAAPAAPGAGGGEPKKP